MALARPWLAQLPRTRRWALRYAVAGEDSVDLALAFLAESAAEEDRTRQAREARRRAALKRARRTALVAGIGFAAMTGLAGWALYAQHHANQVEQQRTSELFDSTLTHAGLLARTEDYAGAREKLDGARPLDGQIPAARRLARDLLARYAAIMGGSADKVCTGAGAGAGLFSVAVSPDGRWVAASGERGTVVLFDAESGELVQRLEGHEPTAGNLGMVYDLIFHPNGDWLASAGADRQVFLWTLPGADRPAAVLRKWQAPDGVQSLAVSPDGAMLASGGRDNAITLWDPQNGKALRTLKGHSARISESTGLAFSPDGTRLASASYDGTARIWDPKTGSQQARLTGHQGVVLSVAFSADGARIVTSGQDGRGILRDLPASPERQGSILGLVGQTHDITSPRVLSGHLNSVSGILFAERTGESGTAPLIVAAGLDRSIRIWDSETAVTQRLLQGHEAGIGGIASRDGSRWSAANDGTVRRWPLALPHQHLLDLPGEPASAALAPDGRSVAVGFADGSLRVWGLPGLQTIAEVPKAHAERIPRLAYSPDGTLLASAGFDKRARVWRIGPDGSPSPAFDLPGHDNAVHAVAFSPDGRRLATAGYDGRVGVFDTADGKGRCFRSTGGQSASVAFDPTGTRVFAADADDGKVRVWSITGDPPTLVREVQATADQLMWAEASADGTRIAAVGRDYVLSVLDTETGKSLTRLPGHEQGVFKARLLPGGHQVATVSADATVRFWDLDTQSTLFTLRLPADRNPPAPLWDFDLRCTTGKDRGAGPGQADPAPPAPGTCWLVVPLTRSKLAVYDLGPPAADLTP